MNGKILFSKYAWLGLQQNYCYNNDAQMNMYYWYDNCLNLTSRQDQIIAAIQQGYSSSYFSVTSQTKLPFGNSLSTCGNYQLYYGNPATGVGPWQTAGAGSTLTNAAAYCRKGKAMVIIDYDICLNKCPSNYGSRHLMKK